MRHLRHSPIVRSVNVQPAYDVSRCGLASSVAQYEPVRLVILRQHRAWWDDSVFFWQLLLCECLRKESVSIGDPSCDEA